MVPVILLLLGFLGPPAPVGSSALKPGISNSVVIVWSRITVLSTVPDSPEVPSVLLYHQLLSTSYSLILQGSAIILLLTSFSATAMCVCSTAHALILSLSTRSVLSSSLCLLTSVNDLITQFLSITQDISPTLPSPKTSVKGSRCSPFQSARSST